MIANLGSLKSPQKPHSASPVVPPTATKSLVFDGVDEFAARADANAQDVGTAGTWSLWVKGAGIGNYGGITCKSDPTLGAGWAVLDSGDGSKKMGIQLFAGANQKRYNTSISVFDNTWHHVVFTFGSSAITVYVDRVLDTPTKTSDQAVTTINNVAAGLRIGSQISNGTPATFYTGSITNFSLWNVALTQTAVTALATGGKPADLSLHANYGSCVSWYKCGDGDTIAANGILDSTANALHLSPTNMEAGDIVTDAP